MLQSNLEEILAQVRQSLETQNVSQAVAIIEQFYPPDQAELISELTDQAQQRLLPQMRPDDVADILAEMDEMEAAELVAHLPTLAASRIVDEMEPDEAVDVLGSMEPDAARAVLAGMEDAEDIRPLLLHPDDTAGGLMTSEFLALRRRMTRDDALQALHDWQPDNDDLNYLFVVDGQRRLCGAVSLRQLIIADPHTPLANIMDPEVIYVPLGTDQEECARLMSRYHLLALPVVDEEGLLVGVITIDDVVDVLEDEATEDIQRLGATEPLDRPYLDTPVLGVARRDRKSVV